MRHAGRQGGWVKVCVSTSATRSRRSHRSHRSGARSSQILDLIVSSSSFLRRRVFVVVYSSPSLRRRLFVVTLLLVVDRAAVVVVVTARPHTTRPRAATAPDARIARRQHSAGLRSLSRRSGGTGLPPGAQARDAAPLPELGALSAVDQPAAGLAALQGAQARCARSLFVKRTRVRIMHKEMMSLRRKADAAFLIF